MEFLPHGDLQQYLSRMPPLPEEAAGDVIYQILEGLSYMHGNSFSHRDLKPGNILIKSCPPQQWWVKIGDFSISKRLDDKTAKSTLLKGTFGFIAPELHELVPPGTSFATDMWALGEIAFQLMTKQPVFKSFGLMARYATQNHQYPLETLLTYRISTPGQDFISSLMVATPEMRLTAEAALNHQWIASCLLLHDQPSSSSPMSREQPATDSITEVLASWNSNSISDSPEPELPKTLHPKGSGNHQPIGGISDPRLGQQEQAGAGRSADASTQSLVTTGHTLQPEYVASSTYTSRRPAPGPAVATASPLSYRKPLTHRPPVNGAFRSTGRPEMPPPSRSGRDVPPSVSEPQHNHNMGPSSRDVHEKITPIKKVTHYLGALSSHVGPVNSVAFSPNGATIASGYESATVRIWDAGTGKQLRELKGHMGWVSSVAFSLDGAYIASGSGDETVRVWEASTGKQLQKFIQHTDYVRCVAFSPDCTTIASGSFDRSVRIWNIGTGKQLRKKLSGHASCVNSVVFSPNGAILASGSRDKSVRIWDAGTGEELRKLSGTSAVFCVAFSPDGATLASGSRDGSVRIWDVNTS